MVTGGIDIDYKNEKTENVPRKAIEIPYLLLDPDKDNEIIRFNQFGIDRNVGHDKKN